MAVSKRLHSSPRSRLVNKSSAIFHTKSGFWLSVDLLAVLSRFQTYIYLYHYWRHESAKTQNVLASIVAYRRKKYNFINYSHTYCFVYPHFKKPATQVCLEAGCTEIPGRGHATKARGRAEEKYSADVVKTARCCAPRNLASYHHMLAILQLPTYLVVILPYPNLILVGLIGIHPVRSKTFQFKVSTS